MFKWIRKLFRKEERVKCTVDYSKRYKIKFIWHNCVCVDCQKCGLTYWAENLKQLRRCIEECSDCKPENSILEKGK